MHFLQRDALFAFPATPRAVTQPSVDYGFGLWNANDDDYVGDYEGIDDVTEIAQAGNGKLLVAGRSGLMRLNANGSLDTTFADGNLPGRPIAFCR